MSSASQQAEEDASIPGPHHVIYVHGHFKHNAERSQHQGVVFIMTALVLTVNEGHVSGFDFY